MQRIAERVRRLERAVAKKKSKAYEHRLRSEAWERNQQRVRIVREHTALLRADRANRAIDWNAGPLLAPRRDVGDKEKTYGAVNIYNIQLPDKDPESRLHKTQWQLFKGDRVVITRGRDVGKIGEITEIDMNKDAVTVKGLNRIDVYTPQWMKQQNGDNRDTVPVDQMISRKDVKLVFPLPDPETGIPRDAVVERMETKVSSNGKRFRVIAGTTTMIPKPMLRKGLQGNEDSEDEDFEDEDFEDDTRRITVEERTFRPFLIRPPMPLTVIDELRNKFSKFRTRHEWEYVQRKEAEEARVQGRTRLSKTMRTPLQELAELRERQKGQQETELTREQLAKIGEVIVKEQARTQGSAQVAA